MPKFKKSKGYKSPMSYAPFKMKHADGNPMKANFKSAFQIHDGKKFEDTGFMDTHFPSGKPRTPAKQLDDKLKMTKKKAKLKPIVEQMKKIEAKLAKNGSLSAEKKKKLKDELLKLSTTLEGQRYTDTGGIELSPMKQKDKKIKVKRKTVEPTSPRAKFPGIKKDYNYEYQDYVNPNTLDKPVVPIDFDAKKPTRPVAERRRKGKGKLKNK